MLTGRWSWQAIAASLPVGCLVASILSGNNLRDIAHDTAAGVKTTAGVLGRRWARAEYASLVVGAYGLVAVLWIAGILPVWSLLVFLTEPLARRNVRRVLQTPPGQANELANIDARSAQVHLAFGVLLIISVVLDSLF